MTDLSVSTPRELAGHYRETRKRLWAPKAVVSVPELSPRDTVLRDVNMRELARLRIETKIFREFLTERGVDILSLINRKAPLSTDDFRHHTIRQIVAAVADRFMVKAIDLVSDCRTRDLCLPRHVAFYLAHKISGKSLGRIGREVGGRDHTSVLHGSRRIAALILADADLAQDVALLHIDLGIKGAQ